MKRFILAVVLVAALMVSVVAVGAQDMTPSVTVDDQLSLDGTVTIAEVVSNGPGWIVIHADADGPGPVIGWTAVEDGMNADVEIELDAAGVTPVLYAMLHADTGEVGVYEFGEVEGADTPVAVDGNVVTPAFNVEFVRAYDQLADDTVNIASVATAQNGWIVIHAAADGAPGPVLGFAAVEAGANTDVEVTLDGDVTTTVFPMLHVDTGEAGVYEFGDVEGADTPVVVDETVAVFPITVGVPSMRVPDQAVTDTVTAESVVSDGPGWLAIHADADGGPGPVIGFAAVEDGTNVNVDVDVDEMGVTPTLFPMLHVDTGEVGAYEFGDVEGADGPVTVDGDVLVFPINAEGEMMEDGMSESMGEEATVTIADFAFGSGELTVAAGTTVTWTNEDGAPHTVTADDGTFNSGNLDTGDTFSFTFDEPGTYAYYCEYHGGAGGEGMSSVVTVEG